MVSDQKPVDTVAIKWVIFHAVYEYTSSIMMEGYISGMWEDELILRLRDHDLYPGKVVFDQIIEEMKAKNVLSYARTTMDPQFRFIGRPRQTTPAQPASVKPPVFDTNRNGVRVLRSSTCANCKHKDELIHGNRMDETVCPVRDGAHDRNRWRSCWPFACNRKVQV